MPTPISPLQPVQDKPFLEAVQARVRALLEGPGLLAADALRARGWLVVPVESASHFDELDATRLAQALAGAGCATCLAVVLDPVNGEGVYRIPATADGLLEFSFRCGHLNVVLMAEEDDLYAVLCSVDDYFLVAGPQVFVEVAIGEDMESAYASFRDFADDERWPEATRQLLLHVARVYAAS